MAKDSLIIQPPNAAPPLRQVILDGKVMNVFDDHVMRLAINPQTLAAGNLDAQQLLGLNTQSAETQAILHQLIRELMDQGILKAPPPPPGEDEVGKPLAASALDELDLGLTAQEREDAERETVRDPLPPKE